MSVSVPWNADLTRRRLRIGDDRRPHGRSATVHRIASERATSYVRPVYSSAELNRARRIRANVTAASHRKGGGGGGGGGLLASPALLPSPVGDVCNTLLAVISGSRQSR